MLLLLFLILVKFNSKFIVHAQLSSNNSNCTSKIDSPCAKLDELLAPCGSKIAPPPANIQSYEYTVNSKLHLLIFNFYFIKKKEEKN